MPRSKAPTRTAPPPALSDEGSPTSTDLETLAGLIAARVLEAQAGAADPWLDRAGVCGHSSVSPAIVSRAFNGAPSPRGGDLPPLHCHRFGERGFPRTRRSVVDAWLAGADDTQQRAVCGCDRYHRWNGDHR